MILRWLNRWFNRSFSATKLQKHELSTKKIGTDIHIYTGKS